MKYSRTINQIFKRCKAGDSYRETTYYFRLIAITIFFIIFFFGLPIYYLEPSLNTYINFGMLITILVGIVFFIGIFYDESRKAHSIKIIKFLIDKLKKGDWNWQEYEILNYIMRLHPIAISHEITMYILGHFLLHEGFTEEGNFLIYRAKDKEPKLNNINLSNNLSTTDARYLYDSLKNEKAFEKANSLRKMWSIKVVRYSLLILFGLFILLHSLVQIANIGS